MPCTPRARGAESPDRSSESDTRVDAGILDVLLESYERANARDEHRRAGLDTEPLQHRHVSHLMDVDRDHEPRRKRPAIGRPVDAEEREHRQDRAELRESKE